MAIAQNENWSFLTQRNIAIRQQYIYIYNRHRFFLFQDERASHLEIVRGILDNVIENVLQQFSTRDMLDHRSVGTDVAQPRSGEIIDLAASDSDAEEGRDKENEEEGRDNENEEEGKDKENEEEGRDKDNVMVVKSILDAILDDFAQIQADKVKC